MREQEREREQRREREGMRGRDCACVSVYEYMHAYVGGRGEKCLT